MLALAPPQAPDLYSNFRHDILPPPCFPISQIIISAVICGSTIIQSGDLDLDAPATNRRMALEEAQHVFTRRELLAQYGSACTGESSTCPGLMAMQGERMVDSSSVAEVG